MSPGKNLILKSIHPSSSGQTCLFLVPGLPHLAQTRREGESCNYIILSLARRLHSPDHFSAGLVVATVLNNKPSTRGSEIVAQTSFITITAIPCWLSAGLNGPNSDFSSLAIHQARLARNTLPSCLVSSSTIHQSLVFSNSSSPITLATKAILTFSIKQTLCQVQNLRF